MEEYSFIPIAKIHNDYKEKFGIPRQSGLVKALNSEIFFEKEFRNPYAIRGLDGFSHIWLVWIFSEQFASRKNGCSAGGWSPTVRPPRLGGNERVGVFATRSPNRPNPIGLSCVRLLEVRKDTPDGPVLVVEGADLMDGTPILDIKPYLPYADAVPDAVGGFGQVSGETRPVDRPLERRLEVTGMHLLPRECNSEAICEILALDPRPAYRSAKGSRAGKYGMRFGEYDIRFEIEEETVRIIEAKKAGEDADEIK